MRARRDTERHLWACMLEDAAHRADGYHELPIMRWTPGRWWPWHPAVMFGLAVVLMLVSAAKGCG